MDLTTILSNLDNIIDGKLSLLGQLRTQQKDAHHMDVRLHVTIEFLRLNIDELQKIRNDLKLISPTKEHKFGIRELEDDYIEFYLDGDLIEKVDHENHGYGGMQAMDDMFRLLAEKLDIVVEELEIQEED